MLIHQYTNFFGSHIPWYGICAGCSLLMIGIWMLLSFKHYKIVPDQQNEILHGFPFMVLTGVLFALLLDAIFTGDWRTWSSESERRFGFTYTGWLFGVLLFILVYGRFTSLGCQFLANLFFPIFALAQAIGRIGCFLSGCCYGTPCLWGVHYPPGSLPFVHVGSMALVPIQLIEAVALTTLFLICVKVAFVRRAIVYLYGVATIRFFAEYFRYDYRGQIGLFPRLTPAQLMSCVFVIFAFVMWIDARHKNPVDLHNPKGA